MENDPNINPAQTSVPQPSMPIAPAMICPQCHQPVQPEYYYCPNCGKKLSEPPLSTSTGAQIWLYAFSIILPFIGYLAISKWDGIKYARSADEKTQEIGFIAIGLLTLSSIFVIWQVTVWIQGFIQSATSTAGLSQLL